MVFAWTRTWRLFLPVLWVRQVTTLRLLWPRNDVSFACHVVEVRMFPPERPFAC